MNKSNEAVMAAKAQWHLAKITMAYEENNRLGNRKCDNRNEEESSKAK
jgi:hypothetical protein